MKRTTPHPAKRTLAQLRKRLKAANITHQMVGDAATPPVRKQTVTHVLAGDFRSSNVLEAALRLLNQAPKPGAVQNSTLLVGAAARRLRQTLAELVRG